jgi:hypothetical protein
MRRFARFSCLVIVTLFLAVDPAGAQFSSGSSGIHGPFPPLPSGQPSIPSLAYYLIFNVTTGLVRYCQAYDSTNRPDTCSTELATAQIPGIPAGGLTTGVFEFTNVSLAPANSNYLYIYFVGNQANNPVTWLSQGDIRIGTTTAQVTIYADGMAGGSQNGNTVGFSVLGGKGGPGGYGGGSGGNGGGTPSNGNPGFGPAGGGGGTASATAVTGLVGSNAGSSPASLTLTPIVGGSGGGGGAGSAPGNPLGCGTGVTGYGGGSGGGGGGAILFAATNEIAIGSASINLSGGNGGYNSASAYACNYLQGGGGEGGSLRLVAKTISGSGQINLTGGYLGYNGSVYAPGGRLRIEALTNSFTGSISGASGGSFIPFPSAPRPASTPALSITSVGGISVTNPTGSFTSPDVNFSSPPTNPVTVGLTATNIPLGTTIGLRAVPLVGAATTATSTALSGTLASSTATASLIIPPGYGSITASASFMASSVLSPRAVASLPRIDGVRPELVELTATLGRESKLIALTQKGARVELQPDGGWSFVASREDRR